MGPAETMYLCDDPIETVECISVNIWLVLDWIWSQNCVNTILFHTVGQLVRSAEKWNAVCMSNRGSDIERIERYQVAYAGISLGAGCMMS